MLFIMIIIMYAFYLKEKTAKSKVNIPREIGTNDIRQEALADAPFASANLKKRKSADPSKMILMTTDANL